MKVTWANLQTDTGEDLLELLHREAEHASLTPQEQALLEAHSSNPDVQAARTALRRAVMFLSGPNPPMPHSVAVSVAADVVLSQQLVSPALPRSLAASVAAEVTLSRQLQTPPIPVSVAQRVTMDIQAAHQLQGAPAPAIPQSVAAAVTTDIQTARQLQVPPMPRSVASAVLRDMQAAETLTRFPAPPAPRASVAAALAARIAAEAQQEQVSEHVSGHLPVPTLTTPAAAPPAFLAPGVAAPVIPAGRNPAPLLLVGALLLGLTLLAITTAWPNLAAGATVLRTLLMQVSPLAGVGLLLLLLTSAIITWKPTPTLRTAGMGAYALSAILTLPALYNVAGGANGLSIGQNVTVSGSIQGNVIAIGGNIHLKPQARVQGEVVTLLGDVHRDPGAQVGGRVNALLGRAPGDQDAIQTKPVSDLSLATAAAFRPVLGWLGAAAWPQIFVALTGSLLLLLFLGGTAPVLARRQRHAPMRTLAMGVLMIAALLLPATGLGLVGLLGPALLTLALTALLIATGLSVSVYDAGRALAYRLNLPVPDMVGAMIGLSAFAASLSAPPLAFALAVIGGTWGAGTLFLTRKRLLVSTQNLTRH